ncbi:hypothetical protein BH09BAC1_BH09BAC1_02620 [soil metagenome]
MKQIKTLVLFLAICFPAILMAQIPQAINYQAVARNANGSVAANVTATVRITVLSGTANGTAQWVETHGVTTNAFGLFTVKIGQGTRTGGAQLQFNTITWGSANHYLKVEFTDNNGNFVDFGTTQLVSVPYALYAGNVVGNISISQIDGINVTGATNGQVLSWNDTAWVPVTLLDNDPTNEIQTIGLSNDTLTLSGGGRVVLGPLLGAPGATGAPGAAGPTGFTGATGPAGATGAQGTGINILGSLPGVGSLPPTGKHRVQTKVQVPTTLAPLPC